MNETIEFSLGTLFGIMVGAMVIIRAVVTIRAQFRKLRETWKAARLEHQAEASETGASAEPGPESAHWGVWIVISLLVILWGVLTGFMVGAFSHLFYTLFLIPLAMGIGSGLGVLHAVRRLNLRASAPVLVLALLSAVVIYGSFHYTRYLGFLMEVALQLSDEFVEGSIEGGPGAVQAVADYALLEETGHAGFAGYMLYQAQEGLSVGRWYRSSRTNLGPVLTPLYWLVEFGILLYVTYLMGRSAASGGRTRASASPAVCGSCGSRLGSETHLGGTATANEPALLELIRQKDFAGMGRLMEANADLPSLEVYYQGCRACGRSQSQLVVRRAVQTAQGRLRFTNACQTVLLPGEGARLLSQVSLSGD